jgi:hypothetical protein
MGVKKGLPSSGMTEFEKQQGSNVNGLRHGESVPDGFMSVPLRAIEGV